MSDNLFNDVVSATVAGMKATEGERIVREWWPKYKSGQWQERIADQIDAAIAAAVRKERERCHQKRNDDAEAGMAL